MAYSIHYLPIAEEDFLSAVRYIANKLEAPKAAASLIDEYDSLVKRISLYPYSFPLYKTNRPMKDEIRYGVIGNYLVFFTVINNTVEIRRFLYGKRNIDNII